MLILNFEKFPVLETERLTLRAISAGDVDEMFQQRSNPDVMKYIVRPLLQSRREAEELVRNYEFLFEQGISITWAMTLKGENKMLGTVGFPRINKENYRGEIGYSLDPEHRNRGYMDEAIKEVIRFGFSQLRLNSIEALIHPENKASSGLIQKHGFVREAYFREHTFFDGKFQDVEIYSLLSPR